MVKQHGGNAALAIESLLLLQHGVEAADGVLLKAVHGAALIEDESELCGILLHGEPPVFRIHSHNKDRRRIRGRLESDKLSVPVLMILWSSLMRSPVCHKDSSDRVQISCAFLQIWLLRILRFCLIFIHNYLKTGKNIMMLKCKTYDEILHWKKMCCRRTALLIEETECVGK